MWLLHQGVNIFLHIVDLSLPKSVWKFVENFKQEHTLNVLINNAGCMVNKRELTEDGLEKNFATNTLGVYVLTTALIPVLEKEHDPRVITVSSGGMLVQKLNTDDPQSERTAFDGTMVYAQNKERESSSPSEAQLSSAWTRVEVRGFSSPRGGATKAATSLPEYLRPTRRVVRAGDPHSRTQQRLLVLRGSERKWTQGVPSLPLGSPCSLAGWIPPEPCWVSGSLCGVCTQLLQSCLTLCNPMDCSPPGSSVQGSLQARILGWVVMPSSRGSSRPRNRTCVSHVSCTGRQVLYH
ncbi:dehydrogenase/reductase SDR family member 12 isoform X3 [Bos javanicus]|uniref:dehydrogenase/reductase SDR family member 12 isoform X3 n=1 Tax=Bos javanicus TaxID=9906 RepID=UPI002AA64501|nr:dehydrogenase/reductase SDR family member 12 isoform X3 [Bos javanicus]